MAACLTPHIREDIKQCYPIENLRNMGQVYMTRLQSVNRDTYQSYKDMRTTFRKYKT